MGEAEKAAIAAATARAELVLSTTWQGRVRLVEMRAMGGARPPYGVSRRQGARPSRSVFQLTGVRRVGVGGVEVAASMSTDA
jgi:hypothetical protein